MALLGVLLGGRLGYLVLYAWERFSGNLGLLFQFGQGGTSFHGGLVGVAVVTWFQARERQVSFLSLGDNLVTVAPLGLMLSRPGVTARDWRWSSPHIAARSPHPWAPPRCRAPDCALTPADGKPGGAP